MAMEMPDYLKDSLIVGDVFIATYYTYFYYGSGDAVDPPKVGFAK